MKDYLFSVKMSDTEKRKRALKELGDLESVNDDSRANMRLKKYQELRTRERKIKKYLKLEDSGVNYE